MKQPVLLFVCLCCPIFAFSQPLQNFNYEYLYNPNYGFSFTMKFASKSKDSVQVEYQLQLLDTLQKINDYTISWEQFETLYQKEGKSYTPERAFEIHKKHLFGTFTVAASNILVAKINYAPDKKTWQYFKQPDFTYMADGFILRPDKTIINGYLPTNSKAVFSNPKQTYTAFYYATSFPPASPPFAESQMGVDHTLIPDSIFTVSGSFTPASTGLYLFQTDTASRKGMAFRAEDNYPKFSRVQKLVEPLSYITTKAEFNKLKNADDKKSFDRIILGITGDTEHAKLFMRNYFQRVEWANRYFTSYKEGWKTDRGMVYIIYGVPNFIFKFADREVWEYEINSKKTSFTFVRSATTFDPENFVLIRKNSYRDQWLEVVDLNRSARF